MPWTGPVFPDLTEMPGVGYPQKRTSGWSSVKQDSLSGKKTRFSLYTYPTYSYELPLSYLKTDAVTLQWQTLIGFINSLNGTVGLFGYTDPVDNTVTGQEFGEGDGSTLGPFQLVRAMGGFAEPIFLLNGNPTIEVGGVANTNWTVDSYGRVTFTAGNAPPSGQILSWSGQFYWPCRFDGDTTEFSRFVYNLFEVKSLKFSTEKLP